MASPPSSPARLSLAPLARQAALRGAAQLAREGASFAASQVVLLCFAFAAQHSHVPAKMPFIWADIFLASYSDCGFVLGNLRS